MDTLLTTESRKSEKERYVKGKIKNKALLNPYTGDIYFYDFFDLEWKGQYNVGFHLDQNLPDFRQHTLKTYLEHSLVKYYDIKKDFKDDTFEEINILKTKKEHFLLKNIKESQSS